jgi:hypothetical protein
VGIRIKVVSVEVAIRDTGITREIIRVERIFLKKRSSTKTARSREDRFPPRLSSWSRYQYHRLSVLEEGVPPDNDPFSAVLTKSDRFVRCQGTRVEDAVFEVTQGGLPDDHRDRGGPLGPIIRDT